MYYPRAFMPAWGRMLSDGSVLPLVVGCRSVIITVLCIRVFAARLSPFGGVGR